MLVLSRKPNERVHIGHEITITIIEARGGRIRIGIEAPDHLHILRGEFACWQEQPAADDTADEFSAIGCTERNRRAR